MKGRNIQVYLSQFAERVKQSARKSWRRNLSAIAGRYFSVLVGLSLSGVTLYLGWSLNAQERIYIERQTKLEADSVRNELTEQLEDHFLGLLRLTQRWQTQGKPSQENWTADALIYLERLKGFQAIAYTDPSFHLQWSTQVIGYNPLPTLHVSAKAWQQMLNLAQTHRRVVLSPIRKVGVTTEFLICVPLTFFIPELGSHSLETPLPPRSDNPSRLSRQLQGFLIGVFHTQKAFDRILQHHHNRGYAIAIFNYHEEIYRSFPGHYPHAKQQFQEQTLNFLDFKWRIQVWQDLDLAATEQSSLPSIVLSVGVIVAWLMALVIYLAQKAQKHVRKVELVNRKLEQEVRNRTLIEETLSRSQQHYQALIEWIDAIVWEADAHTLQFTFVSQQAEHLLGYPVETWLNEPDFWVNHLHPDDRDWAVQYCRKQHQQKTEYKLEYRAIAANGQVIWIKDIVNVVCETHQPVKLRGVMIDITKDKQIDVEKVQLIVSLQESEERLRLALSAAQMGIWDWNLLTHEIHYSEQVRATLGLLPGTGYSDYESFFEAIHPEDRSFVSQAIGNTLEKTADYSIEFRVVCPDGTVNWMSNQGQAYFNENGQAIRMIGVAMDITRRKQAEEALRQSEERWQLALRGNNDGIWDWNLKTNEVFFSNRWKEMLGYTDDDIINGLDEWSKRVHPDDLESVMQAIQNHFQKQTPFYLTEHRVRCKDGTYKWILDRGQALWDEKGNPIRMTGSHTDITEHKHAEANLQAYKERLEWVIRASNDGFWDWDLQTGEIYFSPRWKEMIGYTDSELPNKFSSWEKVIFPADRIAALQLVEDYNSGQVSQFLATQRFYHKNGSTVFILSRAIHQKDSSGKVIRMLGAHTDITELVKTQEELHQRLATERIISNISTGFINLKAEEIDAGINRALKLLGDFVKADRSYVFLLRENGKILDNTHEWCATETSVRINSVQELNIDDFPWMMALLNQFEVICVPQVADLPTEAIAEKEYWQSLGIRSMLCIPMLYQRKLVGCVGFEAVSEVINWTEEDIQILRLVGEILVNLLGRKKIENALRESQRLTRQITDFSPNILYLYDLVERQYLYVNREIEIILGYTQEEVKRLGNSFFQKFVHPEDLERFYHLPERFKTVNDGDIIETEYRMQNYKGEWLWLHSWDTVFTRDSNGLPQQILGTAQDFTQRKKADAQLKQANEALTSKVNELEQRNEEITLLSSMSDLLQSCLTQEEAAQVIHEFLQLLFPGSSGGIFIISNSRNLVEAITTWGEVARSQTVFATVECIALRRGQPYLVYNTQNSLVCKHVHSEGAPSTYLCIPMVARGEAMGVLYVSFSDAQKFTKAKQNLAITVSQQIALAWANLKLHETLQQQSIRDPLTGLFNRRYLEESLERELHRARRTNQSLGICMIDVDYFKNFNDTFGHEAGDAVLRELGLFLQKNLRGSDIACRYGGEELTLILPDASLTDIRKRAEFLREGVKHLQLTYRRQLLGSVTISIGIASFPVDGHSAESLISAADAALYRAKKEGRDRVVTTS